MTRAGGDSGGDTTGGFGGSLPVLELVEAGTADGKSGNASLAAGANATANTGSGGGGGGYYTDGGANTSGTGGNGGSGFVVIKFPDTYTVTIGAGLTRAIRFWWIQNCSIYRWYRYNNFS